MNNDTLVELRARLHRLEQQKSHFDHGALRNCWRRLDRSNESLSVHRHRCRSADPALNHGR
jgi:hypothetical protein